MTTNTRDPFLAQVAAAVRAGNKFRETEQRSLPASVGYQGAGDDPVARFEQELIKVGAQCISVLDHAQLVRAVASLIDRYAVRRVVRSDAPLFTQLGLDAILRAAGVELTTIADLTALPESDRQERLFAADLGIAAPDWVIAETGTLVYVAGPAQTRSATLLPLVHLAVVERRRVLSDLIDLPPRLVERSDNGVLPRNVVLVTGPSKTGDIELKLTTGVHGPGEVHVWICD